MQIVDEKDKLALRIPIFFEGVLNLSLKSPSKLGIVLKVKSEIKVGDAHD